MTEAVQQLDRQAGAVPAPHGALMPAHWRDFWALTKPGVIRLVVFTGLCGLLVAPGTIHPVIGFVAILCIAMGAGGAAALNQYHESDLDALMKRTANRPIPAGRMDREAALQFGLALSGFSVVIMGLAVNWLSAAILAFSIFYYAVIYTVWLKPNTPQNIVIGGGAGAFPPVIGWAAVTGDVTMLPILLFSIIFFWTPPHFWALAIKHADEYKAANVPMLPSVVPIAQAVRTMVVYTVVLVANSLVLAPIADLGLIYIISAAVLGAFFLWGTIDLGRNPTASRAMRLFGFSISYVTLLFGALTVDVLVRHGW